ncbi:MAG TPA: sulfate/thiosulfate ABC transporter permease CysW, partial [bacterium]
MSSLTGSSISVNSPRATTEPRWVRWLLIGLALLFMGLFLFLPLTAVFVYALEKGVATYFDAIRETEALAAVKLTLLTATAAIVLNLIFGVAAAWAIAKFEFFGKNFLTTLIDLPFAVSPVISGLIFVLLFGAHGVIGPWLIDHGVK